MNTIDFQNYEIRSARSGDTIPVINGIHLHSSYNPQKEAVTFADRHLNSLKMKNEALVLGLGFAYHVNEIARLMTQLHGNNFKVVVIEPNEDTHQICVREGFIKYPNITIYSGLQAEEYYRKQELIRFLVGKPVVIAHPPSFNLYQAFFKNFLSYESPKSVGEANLELAPKQVREYLTSFSPETTIDQIAEAAFTQNNQLQELDFLLLALKEMAPTAGGN